MIRTIKDDGLERVAQLNQSEIRFYQFLPLYDVIHLGNVLGRGHAPTSSEMTWALVDGCFVVADALSLAAVQPEGAVAAEAIRAEVKAAAREGAKSLGRELAETGAGSTGKTLARQSAAEGASTASKRWARWWTVRSAGGMYQVLRRLPDALPRLTLAQIDTGGRPPLHPGRHAPDHLAASPLAPRRNRGPVPHPARARVEIPDRPGPPGERRRRRLPEDGRTPGLKKATVSLIVGIGPSHRFRGIHFLDHAATFYRSSDRRLRERLPPGWPLWLSTRRRE